METKYKGKKGTTTAVVSVQLLKNSLVYYCLQISVLVCTSWKIIL